MWDVPSLAFPKSCLSVALMAPWLGSDSTKFDCANPEDCGPMYA